MFYGQMINFLLSKKKRNISKENHITKKLTQQNNKLKIFISDKKNNFNTLLRKKITYLL